MRRMKTMRRLADASYGVREASMAPGPPDVLRQRDQDLLRGEAKRRGRRLWKALRLASRVLIAA